MGSSTKASRHRRGSPSRFLRFAFLYVIDKYLVFTEFDKCRVQFQLESITKKRTDGMNKKVPHSSQHEITIFVVF